MTMTYLGNTKEVQKKQTTKLLPAFFENNHLNCVGFGVNNMQHEQMAAHYINIMAGLLKEFDRGQNSNQFYEDIAWEGLMGTSTYIRLKETEKQRIENTITQLMKNGNKVCN